MGFSNLRWRTQRNFPLCLLEAGRSRTQFGLGLHLYPCLANRSLPFEVYGKSWPPRKIRKSCHVFLSTFSRPPHAPHIWTRPHLASYGTIPLLPRHSPSGSSFLWCLLPPSRPSPISFTLFLLEPFLQHLNNRLFPLANFYPGAIPSKIICETSTTSASTNRFSFLEACSISKVENFSPIFWAIAL